MEQSVTRSSNSDLATEQGLSSIQRLATIIIAGLIIFIRMPGLFATPQFWGEDMFFFRDAFILGNAAILEPVAGYILLFPRLVSAFAVRFPVALAPSVFLYASVATTLCLVWMATSSRFVAQLRPLLAVSLVVVPAGFEVLGCITNAQWSLPIGAIIVLFSKPAKSPAILLCEGLFVLVIALTGPFAIFLTPIVLWLTFVRWKSEERGRLLIFSLALIFGAIVQIGYIYANRNYSLGTPGMVMDYSRTLWITFPMRQMLYTFHWKDLFGLYTELVPTLLLVGLIGLACLTRPFRDLKIAILVFGVVIAVSGMWKYRTALPNAGWRYFYMLSVFLVWIGCLWAATSRLRPIFANAIVLILAAMAVSVVNTPRILEDTEWRANSRFIMSGLPVNIPSSPPGWMLTMPKKENGPLSSIAAWQGQKITDNPAIVMSGGCLGQFESVSPAGVLFLKDTWMAKGILKSQDDVAAKAVLLVDAEMKVVGFALLGFKGGNTSNESGWAGVFSAARGTKVRAYAVSGRNNTVCAIAGEQTI